MALDKYISDLLYRYDCVIVPGFGGFIANRVSAKNIHNQHKFLPPTKEIAFNKHLDKNDGLLANYLMKAKKISYSHAIDIIDETVVLWKNELDQSNTFDIKKVGSFRLNEDRNLEFTADESVNYLTDSYGLSKFTSLSIKRDKSIGDLKQLHKTKTVPKTNYTRKIVRYAAVIVPFIAISALSYYQYSDSISNMTNAKISISPNNTNVEVNVPVKTETKKEEITVKPAETKEVLTVPVVNKPLKYHVISGAFRLEKNANKNIRILNKKGIEAKLIGQNKSGLHIVSYKSFSNFRDAKKFLLAIKAKDNNKAWILKKTM